MLLEIVPQALRPSPQRRPEYIWTVIVLLLIPLSPQLHLHSTMSKLPTICTDVYKQLLAGLRVFSPSSFGTEEDIVTAVHVLEGTLDNESIGPIICLSLQPEHPYVFEFILSCKIVLFFSMRTTIDACHSHRGG